MEYPEIKTRLKTALIGQQMTYSDLGKRIGMTASGVKKLLRADDISLGRLRQICDALNLDMATVLEPPNEPVNALELDPAAQEYFANNQACFYFYFLLLTEPRAFNEIIEEYKIEKRRAYRFLNDLERLRLVIWLPGDRVITATRDPVLFRLEGPFLRQLLRTWSMRLVEDVVDRGTSSETDFLATRILHLNPKSISDLRGALSDLMKEFTRRSQREKRTHRRQVKPVRTLAVIGEGQFVKEV